MKPLRFGALCVLLGLNLPASTEYAPPLPAPSTANSLSTKPGYSLVVEAETGIGEWERLEDSGVTVIRAVQGKSMTYHVNFAEAGVYYVHLRCRQTSGMKGPDGQILADTSTNDVHVLVGGQRLYGSDLTTRPEGMRCHSSTLSWWLLPKGPGNHTPEAIKNSPVTTYLPQAGVYEVILRYRSPGFVVDKIAFTRTPKAPADGGK
ncbi:MAG: hypothetical protein PSV13_13305 [Lacunisphaera sp.]|nr:hypothetical protein [Lacunisphaera sp.]